MEALEKPQKQQKVNKYLLLTWKTYSNSMPQKHREENPAPYTVLGPRQLLVRTPASSSAPHGEERHVGLGGEDKLEDRFCGCRCMSNHSSR